MRTTTDTNQRPRRQRTGIEIGVAAIDRVADRIDLAIDLLTLGQYGLECRERPRTGATGCGGSSRSGARTGLQEAWEAPRTPRRPGCEWDWPARRGAARPR